MGRVKVDKRKQALLQSSVFVNTHTTPIWILSHSREIRKATGAEYTLAEDYNSPKFQKECTLSDSLHPTLPKKLALRRREQETEIHIEEEDKEYNDESKQVDITVAINEFIDTIPSMGSTAEQKGEAVAIKLCLQH